MTITKESKVIQQLENLLVSYFWNHKNSQLDESIITTVFNAEYKSHTYGSKYMDIYTQDPNRMIIQISILNNIQILKHHLGSVIGLDFKSWLYHEFLYRKLDPMETLQSWILRVL